MTEPSGDYITTASRTDQEKVGKVKLYPSLTYIDPWDVKPEQVRIEDIAHGLAILNRYTGGSPFPSNVAMHSVRMARRASPSLTQLRSMTFVEQLAAWKLALAHLLHDGSEALGLNDLASPVKKKPGMEEYVKAHGRSMLAIFTRFELPFELLAATKMEDDYDFHREVKSFYEPQLLLNHERIYEVSWRRAEHEFLSTFEHIQAQITRLAAAK